TRMGFIMDALNLAKRKPLPTVRQGFYVAGVVLSVDHLGAGHIALLVQVIKIAGLLLDADLLDLLRLAALLAAAGHLGARDIALLVDVIKETRRALDADLLNFLSHVKCDLPTD